MFIVLGSQWPAEELRSVVTGPAGERILADTCEDLLNKLLVYDSAHRIKVRFQTGCW